MNIRISDTRTGTNTMESTQELIAWMRIQALMADYWRRVDGTKGAPVDGLFAEEGQLSMGPLVLEGRDAIAAFYAERARRESVARRSTRHMATNLSVEFLDARNAKVCATVQVLAGSGALPLPSQVPATVADVEDLVREVHPGVWRIVQRRYHLVFTHTATSA